MGQIASRYVPIFHTLETIERINRHLALHENAEKPDIMAIEQWLRIRADLQRQLHEMLFDLNALPPLAEPIMKAERPVADGTSMRRIMSVEQMAKIREARIKRNTDAGASNAMTPKPKVEKNTPDGGTKKSR